jgi:hypothetical protein
MQSVAVGFVAPILNGTGRVNAGHGAVMSCEVSVRRSATQSAAG